MIAPFAIEFYNARVLATIEKWPSGVAADFMRLTELLVEVGPNLRLPHSRAIGNGLFELRARGGEGDGRAFYGFLMGRRIVFVHAIVKKTEKTTKRDLDLARARLKEVISWPKR
jgi:phage-related protein